MASSRVGAMTTTDGRAASESGSPPSGAPRWAMTGRRNAHVFPEPVCARAHEVVSEVKRKRDAVGLDGGGFGVSATRDVGEEEGRHAERRGLEVVEGGEGGGALGFLAGSGTLDGDLGVIVKRIFEDPCDGSKSSSLAALICALVGRAAGLPPLRARAADSSARSLKK